MSREPEAHELAESIQELLHIDRTLHPSDRTVLATLLMNPRPTTARELSRATRTNLQALYTSLDRLKGRGLIVQSEGNRNRHFRIAHPSIVLEELSEPWKRAGTLASGLEEPLRQLYESGEVRLASSLSDRAGFSSSLATCMSALLDRLRGASSEVWFVGTETPWLSPSNAVEGVLLSRRPPLDKARVRLLVDRPADSAHRRAQLQRLKRAGVEVRFTTLLSTPTVIIDRRWLFLQSTAAGRGSRAETTYAWIEAPGHSADFARYCEEQWSRLGSSSPADLIRGHPRAPGGRKPARLTAA